MARKLIHHGEVILIGPTLRDVGHKRMMRDHGSTAHGHHPFGLKRVCQLDKRIVHRAVAVRHQHDGGGAYMPKLAQSRRHGSGNAPAVRGHRNNHQFVRTDGRHGGRRRRDIVHLDLDGHPKLIRCLGERFTKAASNRRGCSRTAKDQRMYAFYLHAYLQFSQRQSLPRHALFHTSCAICGLETKRNLSGSLQNWL